MNITHLGGKIDPGQVLRTRSSKATKWRNRRLTETFLLSLALLVIAYVQCCCCCCWLLSCNDVIDGTVETDDDCFCGFKAWLLGIENPSLPAIKDCVYFWLLPAINGCDSCCCWLWCCCNCICSISSSMLLLMH